MIYLKQRLTDVIVLLNINSITYRAKFKTEALFKECHRNRFENLDETILWIRPEKQEVGAGDKTSWQLGDISFLVKEKLDAKTKKKVSKTQVWKQYEVSRNDIAHLKRYAHVALNPNDSPLPAEELDNSGYNAVS